jgi:hypothetical protein
MRLDQQQPEFTGGLSVRKGASQTIKVGIAGALVQIDIPLCAPKKNADVELTVSGPGSNTQSATASITFKHSYADCAWYTFKFSQPISAAVGDVLLLTVETKNHKAALWGYDGYLDNPYPSGAGSWMGHTINDFAFKTYMQ